MNLETYLSLFQQILEAEQPAAPYDDEEYFQYTKMNWARTNRWLKKGQIDPKVQEVVKAIDQPQQWIVITEPWCGDAAQCLPFIYKMAELNPNIELKIELRDQPPFLIEQYLTNGTKSIPKLIIRDASGKDLGVWGPRPKPSQELFESMKAAERDFEEIKEELQKWYNKDAGLAIQQEIADLLKG